MDLRLCETDHRFMNIVWDNEPLPSGELVKLCGEILGWKKSTTYTTLRKLCEKGFLKNEDTFVTSLIPRGEVQKYESRHIVDRSFSGSLPQFVAAFTKEHSLGEDEIQEIYELIEKSRKAKNERT